MDDSLVQAVVQGACADLAPVDGVGTVVYIGQAAAAAKCQGADGGDAFGDGDGIQFLQPLKAEFPMDLTL